MAKSTVTEKKKESATLVKKSLIKKELKNSNVEKSLSAEEKVISNGDSDKVKIAINKKLLSTVMFGLIFIIGLFLVIIGVDAGFQWYESTQIVARIDGKVITRKQLADDMINMGGKTYIDEDLGLRILLENKAKEEGIEVSQEDIEKFLFEIYEVDSVEKLEETLKLNDDSDLETTYEKARISLYVEKLIGDITPTEEQINAELQEYKDIYLQDGATEEDFNEMMESIGGREVIVERLTSELEQQKLEELFEQLDSESTIENYLSEEREYEFLKLYKDLWDKWIDK
ncbi:MAG TPA: hypothetical protein PK957_02765 [Candidatus Dojkabacteria bacterium]|nr:hypothetical protein [Candidatus Dojkabacteria bacterium]HQF36580.1 hypothetical protein [Candidatus Dojkabacteria bacterium]